jgi:glycosyltransferase involved in cell wall biosynthesis
MPRLADHALAALRRVSPGVVDAAGTLPPLRLTAARLHEYCGRLRAAARLADGRRGDYADRLRELAASLADGELALPATPGAPVHRPFNNRIAIALYGCEPWFANGYSIRTRCLLQAVGAAGVRYHAATRPNFPHDTIGGRDAARAAEESFGGINYRRLGPGPDLLGAPIGAYIRHFAGELATLIRATGASLVHAASNHIVGLAACLAAETIGVGSVYEIRGLWHRSTATRWPGWEHSDTFALHERLERQTACRAGRVVVLSRALADYVGGWGVPEERIAIVPNGVDAAAFTPRPRDPAQRAALGATERTYLVGFVGTFTPYEGLDTMLEAVAMLRGRGIDARAALVGSGEDDVRLRRRAAKLRVPAAFPGRVPFEAVPAYLAAFDAYPVPRPKTPVAELVPPLKLAEAMACAVPVVVADLPPLTEIVAHRRTGLVYRGEAAALADALEYLHGGPEAAAAMAEAARAWVIGNRSWRESANRLLTVYAAQSTPAGTAA